MIISKPNITKINITQIIKSINITKVSNLIILLIGNCHFSKSLKGEVFNKNEVLKTNFYRNKKDYQFLIKIVNYITK